MKHIKQSLIPRISGTDTKNWEVSVKQERRFYNRAQLCYQFQLGFPVLDFAIVYGFNNLFLFF